MQAITLFLAILLGVSAAHKVLARERLTAIVARLAHVPLPLGSVLLALAATTEALAAVTLPFPALHTGGALAAAALWCGYALVLVLHKGETLDCGCDFIVRERPVDVFAILRPALLAGLALLTLATPPSALWSLEAPFAGLALLALWLAAGELHSIPVTRKVRS